MLKSDGHTRDFSAPTHQSSAIVAQVGSVSRLAEIPLRSVQASAILPTAAAIRYVVRVSGLSVTGMGALLVAYAFLVHGAFPSFLFFFPSFRFLQVPDH